MKKSIIYLFVCAIFGMMLTTSCQDSLDWTQPIPIHAMLPLIKTFFAVKGRINVKLAKGTNYAIPSSPNGDVEMQSVPSAMASAMKYSGAYKMERVFKPAGIYEARTVAEVSTVGTPSISTKVKMFQLFCNSSTK